MRSKLAFEMNLIVRRNQLMVACGLITLSLIVSSLGWFVYIKPYVDQRAFDPRFISSILNDKVHTETKTADELASKVKILCFVTTMTSSEERAVAVNVTWLKRCTRHVFVSSNLLKVFNGGEVLVLPNVPEGRDHLTAKTFTTLAHFYKHELNNFDWFVKADDDTYMIVENLRLLLSHYSPDDPVYLGHHFRTQSWKTGNGYMSGGASYVLSRQALRIMGEKGLPQNGGICRPQEPDEDVEVGKCLHALGVKPHRTIDVYGRETFHPDSLLNTYLTYSESAYSVHPIQGGPDCCSQLTITFHHLPPQTIYTLELLLYHIDVYGRHSDDVTLRQALFRPQEERLTPQG
ncbi:hypothetical protein ACOMHN_061432 [Nucella lapillus]